jgi:hypothetical protein
MSKVINLYIPRILGKIKQNDIIEIFHNYGIGHVYYIDMHHKINENKKPYYFAFLSLKLYDDDYANYIYYKIMYENTYKFNYDLDTDNYWELKKHVPIDKRAKNKDINKTKNETGYAFETCNIVNEIPPYSMMYIDAFDKNTLEEEYEELQREIFRLCSA